MHNTTCFHFIFFFMNKFERINDPAIDVVSCASVGVLELSSRGKLEETKDLGSFTLNKIPILVSCLIFVLDLR